jgi:hypothetical protein
MNIERDTIPELNIELVEDKQGSLILLEQDSGGNTDRVAIHQIHLRYMAEKFGLITTSDPTAHKTIAMLTRRLLLLRDRMDNLHNYLVNHSDHKHADLSYEVTYATACVDLADEFCAELVDLTPVKSNDDSEKPAATTLQASPQASLI